MFFYITSWVKLMVIVIFGRKYLICEDTVKFMCRIIANSTSNHASENLKSLVEHT